MAYTTHTVLQGEDVVSVAQKYRVRPEDIWDDPKNEALKARRASPNVLYADDVLEVPIPDDPKMDRIATGKRHTFRRKGALQKIILVLHEDDHPRAGLAYELVVEGQTWSGSAGPDGRIEHPVPSTARTGRLTLGKGKEAEEYTVLLGYLDPVDTDAGLRGRLVNLDFLDDPGADELALARAIEVFQEHFGLKATGKVNPAMRAKLVDIHGS